MLVDPEISAAKLEGELEAFAAQRETYDQRGWQLLAHDGLTVELAFAARVPLGQVPVPVISACVRLDFTNYDLWPPSVEFIDYFTREPAAPVVAALHWEGAEAQNVLIVLHPQTGRPFLCLPGVREYHSHHEHTGDDWLLHRGRGTGTLAALCEEIWQRMARNVVGVRALVQQALVPPSPELPQESRMEFAQLLLVQDNPESLKQQALAAAQALGQQIPGAGGNALPPR
jgi:hypothetical protein